MKKFIIRTFVVLLTIFAVTTIGASFYMLDYSLAPDPLRGLR